MAMRASGRLMILALVMLGLFAAAFSWWFRFAATRHAAEYWGAEVSQFIRDGSRVEGFILETAATESDRKIRIFSDRGTWYVAASQRPLSNAPGMTHLRFALLADRSYVFGDPKPAAPSRWRFAIRFHAAAGDLPVTLVFSSDCGRVGLVGTDGRLVSSVCCSPISTGLRAVFAEWLAEG